MITCRQLAAANRHQHSPSPRLAGFALHVYWLLLGTVMVMFSILTGLVNYRKTVHTQYITSFVPVLSTPSTLQHISFLTLVNAG
jgi:hypothetical protein